MSPHAIAQIGQLNNNTETMIADHDEARLAFTIEFPFGYQDSIRSMQSIRVRRTDRVCEDGRRRCHHLHSRCCKRVQIVSKSRSHLNRRFLHPVRGLSHHFNILTHRQGFLGDQGIRSAVSDIPGREDGRSVVGPSDGCMGGRSARQGSFSGRDFLWVEKPGGWRILWRTDSGPAANPWGISRY